MRALNKEQIVRIPLLFHPLPLRFKTAFTDNIDAQTLLVVTNCFSIRRFFIHLSFNSKERYSHKKTF